VQPAACALFLLCSGSYHRHHGLPTPPAALDLCPSLYPSFLYFEPYSGPLPPPPPPTTSSETLGSPSHPRPLPSMVVRNPFLPSLPHPASPRRAAGDRGPPPRHCRWGRGSPARALLSGTRSSTHTSSSPGTRSSALPPPHGRCPLLAHAGKGAFSRRRCRGSGSSSLHV
jgi:hypothetical protein